MASEYRSKQLSKDTTVALDQSALLNLLGELELTDVTDRIGVATETLYQELDRRGSACVHWRGRVQTDDRAHHPRNGSRSRTLRDLDLRIPKLRAGSHSSQS